MGEHKKGCTAGYTIVYERRKMGEDVKIFNDVCFHYNPFSFKSFFMPLLNFN
jgi:hypothetical protein